jgi:hypothetical protein
MEMKIWPDQERAAELWFLHRLRKLTEDEEKELYGCMRINAYRCLEIAHKINTEYVARMTNDVDWINEICLDEDLSKENNTKKEP